MWVLPVSAFYLCVGYTCVPVIPVCGLYLCAGYTCVLVIPVCGLYVPEIFLEHFVPSVRSIQGVGYLRENMIL